jgi:PAS domain S-box-containing protein
MTLRILCLEDNPDDAEIAQRELRQSGIDAMWELVDSREGFEASLRLQAPDLILSDHNVPGFGGRAALVVARELRPEVPFVLFTGSLSEEAAVEYMKAGAADYIIKDRAARLGPAVGEALARARERRELKGYEVFLRQIMDANPNPIFVKDRDGRFLLANSAMSKLYGARSPEELVGCTDADFGLDPATRAAMRSAEALVWNVGKPQLVAEETIAVDGASEARVFQTIRMPLTVPGRDGPTLLGVATDITERKRLEDQLRHSQKLEAVGQLAGGVAHDFNNLLSVMLGHTELLLQELPPGDSARDDVVTIQDAAQRAAQLTRQLLTLSRRQVLQPRVVDLNLLLTQIERLVRRVLPATIEVKLDLTTALASVRADVGQLEQVVMNLIVNARDAMPDGGVLTLETRHVDLDDAYLAKHPGVVPGRFVCCTIRDTGTGMAPETRARLFEPFFTTKGPTQGTGLGLAVVYGIVKQSGGDITVDSEPGRGASFHVYLPSVTETPVALSPVDGLQPPSGSETVLLVEDNDGVRRLTARILRMLGYDVLEAINADEADERAATHPGIIHALVTDLVMPGRSGREVATAMRLARPGIVVIYVSGYSGDVLGEDRPLEPGAFFLQKPYRVASLARVLRDALDTVRRVS